MPKVSALMPVYNTNLAYLKETIESVLNQTFTDFEFLILNDSPQNLELENFILEYAKQDKRIKYFKNPRNLGISPSRNKLIDLAQGEFLAVIDHDDISVKERFEKEVAFLEANEEVGVVGGNITYMKNECRSSFPLKTSDIKLCLMHWCCVAHQSSMIRKSILQKNKIHYNAFYSPCEDYKLWCDLIDKTEFANLDEVMIRYRNYQNTSESNLDKMDKLTEVIISENKEQYPKLFTITNALYTNQTKEQKIIILGLPIAKIIYNAYNIRFYLFGLLLCKIVHTKKQFTLYFLKIRLYKRISFDKDLTL